MRPDLLDGNHTKNAYIGGSVNCFIYLTDMGHIFVPDQYAGTSTYPMVLYYVVRTGANKKVILHTWSEPIIDQSGHVLEYMESLHDYLMN